MLLDREFKIEGSPASQQAGGSTDTIPAIELLKKTIGMLENELDQKNIQIAQFQERDRESNFLIRQTTEKLAMLTEGKKQQHTSDAVTVDPHQKEGSQPNKSSHQPEPQSLWRLFTTPVQLRNRRNK